MSREEAETRIKQVDLNNLKKPDGVSFFVFDSKHFRAKTASSSVTLAWCTIGMEMTSIDTVLGNPLLPYQLPTTFPMVSVGLMIEVAIQL